MLLSSEIARLEEARQARLLAELAATSRPFAGGVMGFDAAHTWHNHAVGVGLDGAVGADEIDAMIEFYATREVEARVELTPFAHPTLIAGLGQRGFIVREFENLLARELTPDDDLDALRPELEPAGLELRPVDKTNEDQLRQCALAIVSGFYPEGEDLTAMVELGAATNRLPGSYPFLALIDGEVAGAGSAMLDDRVACLSGVAVYPRFRRRGIQRMLMVKRLEVAREHGCVVATIGSRPGEPTERNALRLGFCVVYSKVIVGRPTLTT
ncbi:Acetyltransferase (GNAT) family protein [Enhygromyxa salina]|uniref:Acetyltransferase (GNAT) family protein n=1 Tax=Enhygromyxa salina TaxID=215803 RepID=A0A2S9XB05_9BACT|nr:GNAT family N-acetyltransferase [Enhygromyxa salina]PRP90035.1 Acetyltransferase (GNAT) family protein [Enhygromyxa salina]